MDKETRLNQRVTLAVNPAWMPSHFLTKRRCFELLIRGRIDAIDKNFKLVKSDKWFDHKLINKHSDMAAIASVREKFLLPSIIVLNNKFMKSNTISRKNITFDELCHHFNYTCQICKHKFPRKLLSVEHIDPISKSHNNEDFNKTLTCRTCNREKDDIENWLKPDGEKLSGITCKDYVKMKFFVKNYRDEWGNFFIKSLK